MIPEEAEFSIIYAARYRGLYTKDTHRHILFQLYVLANDSLVFFDGHNTVHPDHKSQVILIKPNSDHVLRLTEKDDEDWLAPGVNCALDCKFSVNGDALRESLMLLPSVIDVGDTAIFKRLASLILTSLELPDDSGKGMAYSAMNTLLGLLVTEEKPQDEPYFFSCNLKQVADTEGINAVKRYIDTHYREQIKLDDLVQLSCINRTKLCETFRRYYGYSPIDYVVTRRLEEARLLLSETSLEIGKLAERVGFSGAAYFTRLFKRKYGITPAEHRKNRYFGTEHNNK